MQNEINMSTRTIISTSSSSVKAYIPREKYAAALAKSIEYEQNGDELPNVGKTDLAMRAYEQSLAVEEMFRRRIS
jgi:hypothetical protein